MRRFLNSERLCFVNSWLTNHNAIFQELIERSDDVVIVTDDDFQIIYGSTSAADLFGRVPTDIAGRRIPDLLGQEITYDLDQRLPLSNAIKREIPIELAGERIVWMEVSISRIFPGSAQAAWAFRLHDITERKVREHELVRANSQLDQMIFKTAHDLKAPLMSALSLVNLAQQSTDKERVQYLELVKTSLMKLDGYLEEINGFFRNEKLAGQRQEVDMKSIVSEELAKVRTLYEGFNIEVQVNIDGTSVLYSDAVRIKTVLANLISNAIKYRDPLKSEPFIHISVSIDDENCVLCCTDNGIGIAPEYQHKIFDLFFRATNESQGTGLGLFIVRDTVEKLQGKIDVSSEPGKGTTFCVRIPNQILQPVEVG